MFKNKCSSNLFAEKIFTISIFELFVIIFPILEKQLNHFRYRLIENLFQLISKLM